MSKANALPGAGRLQGRRIVVTGAASGIGRAVAELFVAEGAHVAAVDIQEASPLPDANEARLVLRADVTSQESVNDAVATAAQTFGGLDGLVHAAGIGSAALAEELTLADWRRIIDVNLTGTFLMCTAVLPHLRQASGGTIVTMSSGLGLLPFPRRAGYAASKAGVIAFSKAIAMEWAPAIRVNTICPGTVDTPMVRGAYSEEELNQKVGSRYALGRVGTPAEIARAALYLSSDESSFVTGVALAVDGGRSYH